MPASDAGAGSAQGGNDTRCAVVALIGAPNAGKSTLLNAMTGAKVSIVTHKVQTTRTRVRGIAIEDNCQLVLVDTPGIFVPKRRLDRAMVDAAWGGARDADIVALLVDAASQDKAALDKILSNLRDIRVPKCLLLNKVDLVKKDVLLSLTHSIGQAGQFDRVFMISALSGDGVDAFRDYLVDKAPAGPWLFPEDQISDAPMRLLAAEITREKLMLRLHQELPYASAVETTAWKELKKGRIRIEQTVYVMRDSQKKIVLGKQGNTIKSISMEARKELSEILEAPVDLFIFVKVRQNWGDDPERYRELGLEYPKD